MNYYRYEGHTLCAWDALPYERIGALPGEGEIIFLFAREMLAGRETFPVTDAALLMEKEGVETLDASAPGPAIPAELEEAIRTGRVRAVNRLHPRWQELLSPPSRRGKYRVNLLGLGDVGSTLLQGLRLLGGDIIASIGICDLRENVPQRWEFELNQIGLPWAYDALPPVEIIGPEELFDGDVFLFCASRFVPDTAVKNGDVRMAQYELNRDLAALYAKKARAARYKGLFCVVSDPVDPLCRAVLEESNRDETGRWDGGGLFSHQVRGFGLATGQFRFFIGAFYLFFINTVFIALATYMVVRMLKYHKKKFLDPARERYVKRIMLLITLLTFIPSVVIGLHMVRVSFFESAVDRYVQQEFQFEHTRVIECKKAYKHGDRNSRIELLLIGEPLGEEIIGNARAQLYNYGLQDVELIVRQARTGDRVDLKSLQLSYSELLDEKNAQIDELKQRLSKYKMKNIEYDDISREAGAVVPDIQSISLSKCLSYDVGGTVQDTLLICVVKSRQPMTEADAERLRRWLEVRTKIAQVKLYTE
mgnify:CR=1 FL=1